MPLRTLFLDLNAFFASVQQQDDPRLRGRPIAVVPVVSDHTCCIAVSYEARAFGIRTGTPVHEARHRCPDITFICSRTGAYVDYHHRIIAVVESCLPVHRVWSIDEMECRLMGREREPDQARALARQIKSRIAAQIGTCLTSSIGIAPNRLLAKLASDMQKPDGLVVLREEDLPDAIAHLKLNDLPGIGPRMMRRLEQNGIRDVTTLCLRSRAQLITAFGSVIGGDWHDALHGGELPEIHRPTRTISHEHVLPPALRHPEGAYGVLVRLVCKAAARARRAERWVGAMQVDVRFTSRDSQGVRQRWQFKKRLSPATSDTLYLLEQLRAGWTELPHERDAAPMKVRVTLLDLKAGAAVSGSLFEEDRRGSRLAVAMDAINNRFGRDTLYPAAMHHSRRTAPARIAFGAIPDSLDVEEKADPLC